MLPKAAPAIGTASLEPGLGLGVELGEAGVLLAVPVPPVAAPPPVPEELLVEVEVGAAEAGVLVHLLLWQGAVEVTMAVELMRLGLPVIMGAEVVEATAPAVPAVPVIVLVVWCMALASGSPCLNALA